ncbi:MAG: TlpA disulfide reductase family protein [Bacteroidia bacterium]
MPGKKSTSLILLLLCLCSLRIQAQRKPKIYKIDKLISRYTQPNDTLYIVNFWATWCKPCVAELPAFERIQNEYKEKAVKVILVTMDFKEDIKTRLLPFLKKNAYKAEVALLDEVNGNTFINKVDSSWTGAIPATLLRMGNRKKFIEKQLKFEQLKEEISGFGK